MEKAGSGPKCFTECIQKYRLNMIPRCWLIGRAVLLSSFKDLEDEKNYQPTICLNTSYKILTGLIAKYMREHTLVSKIWTKDNLQW